MTALLSKSWEVDRESERIYAYAPGETCIDLCSGTPENRARVMALLAQVQELASAALQMKQCPDPRSKGGQMARERMDKALRDAGVLDVSGADEKVGP